MANQPQYAATPRIGNGPVSTANTNRDGTGTIVDILTAGTNGTRIDEVVIQATGDPADSSVTIFIYDGAAWSLWDEIDIGNPAAASATVGAYRASRSYANLVLPAGGTWKLGAAITAALTAGVIEVWALGGDL